MTRLPFALACSVISFSLVAGCTQPIEEGTTTDTGAVTKAPAPAPTSPGPRYVPPPPPAPRYNASVGTAPCAPIAGDVGTWSASPTFAGDSTFCAYTWVGVPANADTVALFDGLRAVGVDSTSVVRDAACEAEFKANPKLTTCTRPTTEGAFTDGSGGGGQYSCRSCVKASPSVEGYLDVVLPESLVTPGVSGLLGVFKSKRVSFSQPGGVSAFRANIGKAPSTTSATGGCEDQTAAVLPPWGNIGVPTGPVCNGNPNM